MPHSADELRIIATHLPRPLVYTVPTGAWARSEFRHPNWWGGALADRRNRNAVFRHGAGGSADLCRTQGRPPRPDARRRSPAAEEKAVHRTIGLDALLDIERRTVEK